MGPAVENIKDFLLFWGVIDGWLGSPWLFVRLAPICFVVEVPISYFFLTRVGKFKNSLDKYKIMDKFWTITFFKPVLGVLIFLSIYDEGDSISYARPLGVMMLYYFFTIALVIAAVVYGVRRLFSSAKPSHADHESEMTNNPSGD